MTREQIEGFIAWLNDRADSAMAQSQALAPYLGEYDWGRAEAFDWAAEELESRLAQSEMAET